MNGNQVKDITDKDGHYMLENVIPGSNYKIKVELPDGYMTTIANAGADDLDSDANSEGFITVINPTVDNNSYDVGIYCECDDYKARPQEYKSSAASTLNIFGGALAILALGFMVVRRREEA